MNTLKARNGLTTLKITLVTLLAACLGMALGAAGAQAAPAAGQPFNAEFNHVGLNVSINGVGDIDQLILTPDSKDESDNPLPPLKLHGSYQDGAGNFVLPKATGLEFPDISMNLGTETSPVPLGATIGLAEDATGRYDESSGKLEFHAKLTLILEIADLSAVSPSLPSGDLKCRIAPLDIAFSSENKWPHAGEPFADKANLRDGAVAGAFLYRPESEEISGSLGSMCPTLGGLIAPVGGAWLGNYTTTLAAMPPATGPKPEPGECKPPTPVGKYPDCSAEPVTPNGKSRITRVKVSNAKVKAGKKARVTIKVTNKGDAAFNGRVTLKSSKKTVKVAKSVKIKVAAGKTAAVKVVVKAARKAKGKVTITAKAGGKTGKGKVTVQKAKKRK